MTLGTFNHVLSAIRSDLVGPNEQRSREMARRQGSEYIEPELKLPMTLCWGPRTTPDMSEPCEYSLLLRVRPSCTPDGLEEPAIVSRQTVRDDANFGNVKTKFASLRSV